MKERMKHFIVLGVIALTAGIGTFALPASSAVALNPADEATNGYKAAGGGDKTQASLGQTLKTVTNVLLFILGAISVIMIIVGGIRYTLSNGDTTQITGAKNTIMYAVIGVVVALLAYAIVNFVVGQFS